MGSLPRVVLSIAMLATALAPFAARADSAHLVKSIVPGLDGSPLGNLVDLNGILIFRAADAAAGNELWRSDGTAAGTFVIKDIVPGPGSSAPSGLYRWNNQVFFSAIDAAGHAGIWKTDGTAAGTVLVQDLGTASSPHGFTAAAGALYFVFDDGVTGQELWKTDGTAAGTGLVSDANPGPLDSSPESIVQVGSSVLFFAEVLGVGRELFKTDGTAAGTTLVADIEPGPDGSVFSSRMFVMGTPPVAYFAATTTAAGTELWRSDGSAAGTSMVVDLNPGPPAGSIGQYFQPLDATHFLMIANDGATGLEPWKTDGTAGGTVLVLDINPGAGDSFPLFRDALPGGVVFVANNGTSGIEPWFSDGTAGGTFLLKDVFPGATGSFALALPYGIYGAGGNGLVYFGLNDGVTGVEPWRTDGTTGGTVQVSDVLAGPGGSNSNEFVRSGSLIYFQARFGPGNNQLYAIPVSGVVDSDGDGLSDEREDLVYNTSAAIPDTDGDGLTDGQEVNTYGTDPLNPDTDGDGYSDGDEVAAGSDPLDRSSIPAPIPALPPLGAIALGFALAALLVLELGRAVRR